MRRSTWAIIVALVIAGLCVAGCSSAGASHTRASAAPSAPAKGSGLPPLPDSAYALKPGLPSWVDTVTGYDTARTWKLDGGAWPIMLVMSPSQSPQLLAGWNAGAYKKALAKFGITPTLERIDGPPRTFHALERSQWPFVYMPLAVFMDYTRSPDNQGSAGGLQYVAIAGSTAGGGYTLMTRDPAIRSVADLRGRKVGQLNSNPVPGTLLTAAAKKAGLKVGSGPDDIHLSLGPAGEQMNAYAQGKLDAIITFNILKRQLELQGSRAVTDFSALGYKDNYTILCVERSVLTDRPDVVKAFLEAHYEGQALAAKTWGTTAGLQALMSSWNGFYRSQRTDYSSQRPVATLADYKALLGAMSPEVRLDRSLIADCFAFDSEHGTWGWPGTVDPSRMVDYGPWNAVLREHGQAGQ